MTICPGGKYSKLERLNELSGEVSTVKHALVFVGVSLFALASCEGKEQAARLERAKDSVCISAVVLQATAKDAGETIDARLARLAEVQTQCDSEIFGQALRADDEAAIAWLKKLADESATE